MTDTSNKLKGKNAKNRRFINWLSRHNVWNIIKGYFRMFVGLVGGTIIFCIYCRPFSKKRKAVQSTIKAVWLTAIWFLLWLPVPIQAIGFFVFFSVPFVGLCPYNQMIPVMFNEMLILMFIGNYLSMLLNCSGIDKRVACWLLCVDELHTSKSLASRTMMAGFFLGVISNRMISTVLLIEMVVLPFDSMWDEQEVKKYNNLLNPFNYDSYKAVLCSAIISSVTIGSFCIQHHNISLMQMRALFAVSGGLNLDYPDVFNYLMFTFYSVPTAIVMFIFNYCYHMTLASWFTLSQRSVLILHGELRDRENNTVRVWTFHQMASVFFFIFMLFTFMTRWCSWLDMGWASERHDWASHQVPGLKDATTAAIFIVILHLVPNSLNFFKECSAQYLKDVPPNKPASSLLFWKTNHFWSEYPVLFIIGAGLIILHVTRTSKLDNEVWAFCEFHQVTEFYDYKLTFVLFGVYVASVQFMNGLGTHALSMPFLLLSAKFGDLYWPQRLYMLQMTLGIGFGSSLGFMAPHKHYPVYYSRDRARVGRIKMMLCGFMSAFICFVVLYASLLFLPKLIWDPEGTGVAEIPAAGQTPPTTSTTTETPITTTGRTGWWWNQEAFL